MTSRPPQQQAPERWLRQREAFLRKNKIRIERSTTAGGVAWPGWVRVEVSWRCQVHTVWLDDEYDDLLPGSPMLSLEVLLRSLSDYADYVTAEDWAEASASEMAADRASRIWSEGLSLAHHILPHAQDVIDQVSDLDDGRLLDEQRTEHTGTGLGHEPHRAVPFGGAGDDTGDLEGAADPAAARELLPEERQGALGSGPGFEEQLDRADARPDAVRRCRHPSFVHGDPIGWSGWDL